MDYRDIDRKTRNSWNDGIPPDHAYRIALRETWRDWHEAKAEMAGVSESAPSVMTARAAQIYRDLRVHGACGDGDKWEEWSW